ncbi:MAG TPA: transporter substrate-binding domain-containing protein, partial [Methylomirabilota bacterium]|nr:transporter substrate-binding domain-containing protein [Methylomirabilota bacterium]
RRLLAASALVLAAASSGSASAQTPPAARTLTVGVFSAPPYTMKSAGGTWQGIAVDLWDAIARELGLQYRFQELEPDAALTGVEAGGLDALVGPVAVTPEREQRVDFSHMFYTTGLGIAVPRRPEGIRWASLARAFLSPAFLGALLGWLALLVAAGAVTWLLERQRNPKDFGGGAVSGIGAGVWWSAVTFTGVGYGDKIPMTVAGRVVAVTWMLVSVVLVTFFTGFVSARVAISHFEQIRTAADLRNFRVAVVDGSPAVEYLRRQRVKARRFAHLADAVRALAREEVDGLVHGEAALKYEIQREFSGVVNVLPDLLEREFYAFPLPTGSPLRESLNVALLRVTTQPAWRDIQFRYLGH